MGFIAKTVFALMALGMLGGITLWLVSPAKMLIDGNKQEIFPRFMLKRTADGLPINTLILQGVFITLAILLSDFLPTVDAIYNVFVMASSILLFSTYVFMLVAFIKMKFTRKTKLLFEIPGGKVGAIIVFIPALTVCLLSIVIPIILAPQGTNVFIYELETIGIPIILTFLGFLLYRKKLNCSA
jgi:amino acid transporter